MVLKRFRIITITLAVIMALLVISGCAFFDGEAKTSSIKSDASTSGSQVEYVTPEQFGAKGDGKTDDTQALSKCLQSSTKYVLLRKKYVITKPLETSREKYFYAESAKDAAIICNITNNTKALDFYANVTFENTAIYSQIVKKGKSPHGETYNRTSNIVLIEVWNKTGEFKNCAFYNGLIAIRGRKATSSSVIPQKIAIENCTFIECKIPVQGYSKVTTINRSTFINDGELYRKAEGAAVNTSKYNGDVYSGDHCVYMERYGCEKVTVTNSTVKTLNSESGAAFQIYGSPKSGDGIPTLTIDRCTVEANGVASARAAHVEIKNVEFREQKDQKYIASIESGSLTLRNSEFYHGLAFTYAGTSVKPVAYDCKFQLMTSLTQTRCNFPFESHGCTYVNWGGNVRVNHTSFFDCTFTKNNSHVLGSVYVRNSSNYQVDFVRTTFKSGDTVTNNQSAVSTWEDCTVEN